MTLVPLLVRAAAFAAALAALLLAAPADLRLAPVVLAGIVVLAALPAALPAGPWAAVVIVVTAVAFAFSGGRPGAVAVLVLAALLYCVHALTALAAALPYDAVVAPDVLVRWLLRMLMVIAAGSLLVVAVLAGLDAMAGDRAHAAATVAGLGLAVALGVVLSWFGRLPVRRRSRRG